MVIDCFPFFNELELLEIRLEELKDVVDHFVLIEAAETFSGKTKPCVFESNRHRFERYPITCVKISRFPHGLVSPWQREGYSRNALASGLNGLQPAPNDIIMLSDVDEIPRADAVAHVTRELHTNNETTCYVLEQTLSHYYVNCITEKPWGGTRIIRFHDLTSFQALRESGGQSVPNAGWHFSYLGGTDRIREKIGAYAHTEMDTPEITNTTHIEAAIAAGTDLFGRNTPFHLVPFDARFPKVLLDNRHRFEHLIAPKRATRTAEELYAQAVNVTTDINEHLPYLYRLASTVESITELGTRRASSTSAFLLAHPTHLTCYDLERSLEVDSIEETARAMGIEFTFHAQDVLTAEIEETDLLFIDTWHVEQQMREELARHADKARRYLVMHDTETYAYQGETPGYTGIWPAISEYMKEHPEWHMLHHFPNNNGLTVFTRV